MYRRLKRTNVTRTEWRDFARTISKHQEGCSFRCQRTWVLGYWPKGILRRKGLRYKNLELKRSYLKNEDEKKKNYNERVLNVENGTLTPLVFSTHGGMGRECKKFYQRLTEMIAEKRDIPTSVATKYVRTRMSFSLLRSTFKRS